MLLRPINPAAQLPDVDQVADDVKNVDIVVPQKIQQGSGVRAASPEMNIGNPGGTNLFRTTLANLRSRFVDESHGVVAVSRLTNLGRSRKAIAAL